MKTTTKSYLILYTMVLACALPSCSDGDPSDPLGTTAINIKNEENGKTRIGNSDVYINKANNFYTNSCYIFDMGRKKGLGSIDNPNLATLSKEVAVQPGNGYIICKTAAVKEFPSGAHAIAVSAELYKVYIDSWLKEDDEIVGVNARYVSAKPNGHKLPEIGSAIGTIIPLTGEESLNFELPSKDCECIYEDNDLLYTINGKHLTVRINQEASYSSLFKDHFLSIRHDGYYTRVYIRITDH